MKRFWTVVDVVASNGGFSIALDGRPLKTPARATLSVPTPALAEAIAAEWRDCGDEINPRAMPMTGLANAAMDRVAADPEAFAGSLARYAEGDLLAYRADHPQLLVDRMATRWDPLLAWARRRYAVDFAIGTGVIHIPQPEATVKRLAAALAALGPFELAAMAPLITIGGSLVTALAVHERAVDPATAWDVVGLDEQWQIEQWGADAEAEAALESRRGGYLAAARFLELIG